MQTEKYPIRRRYQAKVGADGTGSIRSQILEAGQVLDCESVAFRNRTGARGALEVYIKQGAALVFLCDQTSPAADTWYWYPYTQTIKEGEQIEAQQASCLNGDVLDLHIIGHITYEKGGRGKSTATSKLEPVSAGRQGARQIPIVPPRWNKQPRVVR